jgi:carboxylesterase type B
MGNTLSYQEKSCEVSLGDRGAIKGLQFDDKSRRFTNVRYALPPTNEHRWRKPRPLPESYKYAAPDGSPFDATQFGPVCPQKAFHVVDAEGGDGKFGEDCLVMNIWTPVPKEGEEGKKWPVMLWLHGGWFQMGDPSHEPGMNPTELISTGGLNAIVVAIGYRLNVFGFLAGHDVSTDNNGTAGGNFGLWDQRLGAEWVKENISFFGGDPENITLAGRSAGAYSAEAQMLYEFRGAEKRDSQLYRRIFMDSNAIPAQPKSLDDGQNQFNELCEYFEVDLKLSASEKLDILRQKTSLELVQATAKLTNHTFRPITDDLFIHSGMVEYLQSKDIAKEFTSRGWRILIGEVRNEETLYSTYNSPTEATLESLRTQVANYYAPDVTDRVIERYSLPDSQKVEDWQNLFGKSPQVLLISLRLTSCDLQAASSPTDKCARPQESLSTTSFPMACRSKTSGATTSHTDYLSSPRRWLPSLSASLMRWISLSGSMFSPMLL